METESEKGKDQDGRGCLGRVKKEDGAMDVSYCI